MLDRAKLMKELHAHVATLFTDHSGEFSTALQAWQALSTDPTLCYKIRTLQSPWLIPSWTGRLDQQFSYDTSSATYHVISVDGSQIYPDRHYGVSCYLLNIGFVHIHYQVSNSTIQLHTEPYLCLGDTLTVPGAQSTDVVNAQRHARELQAAVSYAQHRIHDTSPQLVLFDGSLIFWHLEKDTQLKETFFAEYCQHLDALYQSKTPCASYISMPKSKELVNIIRLALREGLAGLTKNEDAVEHVLDAHIASFFLAPYTRTIIFQSNAAICAEYPAHLKPYFFYVHVQTEIARVEIPAWIAHNDVLVDMVTTIIIDQARKGGGYPVALAEAHEQAVVKGPDREFFYQCIMQLSIEHKRKIQLSTKSMKKRYVTI